MPDRVEFAVANMDRQVEVFTDGAGQANVEVRGHARAKALPGSPKEKPDEFAVSFSAQQEKTDAYSGANLIFDVAGTLAPLALAPVLGPGVALISGPSAISLAIDLFKLAQHNLGSRVLPFTDWETVGWRVDEPSVGTNYRYTATICDLSAPFTVFENEAAVFGFTKVFEQGSTHDFTPTGDGVYSTSFTSYIWDEQERASGGFYIDGTFPAQLVYTTPSNEPAAILVPSFFPGVEDLTFTLIPDPTVCDLPPDTRTRASYG